MRRWIVPLVIIISVLIAIIFRIILPFGNVFTEDGVLFNTVDAYHFIRYAEIPNIPVHDFYLNYPAGINPPTQMLFSQLIKFVSDVFRIDVLTASAWIPPILFLLSLIPFYFMVRKIFNNKIALISFALICIIPGQLLHRTMLGAADHHCLEIFLLSLILCYLVFFIKDKGIVLKIADGVVVIGACYLYGMTWSGAFLLLGISVLIILGVLIRYNKYVGFVGIGMVSFISIVLWLSKPTIFRAFSININETVVEELPLLFAGGKFDLTVIWGEYGIGFFVALIGLGILIYQYIKHKDIGILAFLSITAIILAMSVAKRRFTYYLSYEVVVLIAYTIYYFYMNIFRKRENRIKLVIACLLIFSIPLMRSSVDLSLSKQGFMTKGWIEATDYLKQFSSDEYYTGVRPKEGVLSWWNNGYWIIQRSRMPAMATPGSSDRISAAMFLLSHDDKLTIEKLNMNKLKYIVVDKDMVTKKWPYMINYIPEGEKCGYNDYLMVRLYFDENVKGIDKVFESSDSEVKIFKVVQ
jgi:asparagine N-glycosylation enzyme membrane subunit Stt3